MIIISKTMPISTILRHGTWRRAFVRRSIAWCVHVGSMLSKMNTHPNDDNNNNSTQKMVFAPENARFWYIIYKYSNIHYTNQICTSLTYQFMHCVCVYTLKRAQHMKTDTEYICTYVVCKQWGFGCGIYSNAHEGSKTLTMQCALLLISRRRRSVYSISCVLMLWNWEQNTIFRLNVTTLSYGILTRSILFFFLPTSEMISNWIVQDLLNQFDWIAKTEIVFEQFTIECDDNSDRHIYFGYPHHKIARKKIQNYDVCVQ